MKQDDAHRLNIVGTILFVFGVVLFFKLEEGIYFEKMFNLVMFIVGMSLMILSGKIDTQSEKH